MRCYISGPMRGYRLSNFPAFMKAARILREEGHVVFNPAERDIEHSSDPRDGEDPNAFPGQSVASFMADDMQAILNAEAIVLLPGWERSRGARAEAVVAYYAGKRLLAFHETLGHVNLDVEEPSIAFKVRGLARTPCEQGGWGC